MPREIRPPAIHPMDCPCPRCTPFDSHPALRRAERRRVYAASALYLALFWAFPGRWLISAALSALTSCQH